MLSSSVWRGRSQSWFVAGLILGGVASATLIATLGSLLLRPLMPSTASAICLLAVALLVVLREFDVMRIALPQNSRQVPQRITSAGPRFGALQFGFEMGTGMRTFMTSSAPYLLLACIALSSEPLEFLVAGISFGLGRAFMTIARNASPDNQVWDSTLSIRDRTIRRMLATASVLLVVAVMSLQLVT